MPSSCTMCIVPHCKSTSTKTPKKIFIHVPKNITYRKLWFEAIGRNLNDFSASTKVFCCEDHFDLPNDMKNWIKFNLLNRKVRKVMKDNVVPHKFKCLENQNGESESLLSKKPIEGNQDMPRKLNCYRQGRGTVVNRPIYSTENSHMQVQTEHVNDRRENLIMENHVDVNNKTKKTLQGNNKIDTQREHENAKSVYLIVDANKKNENNSTIKKIPHKSSNASIQNEFEDSTIHCSILATNVKESLCEGYRKDCLTTEDYANVDCKLFIEETTLNLDCVKKEVNEIYDFNKDILGKQYKITLSFESLFGEEKRRDFENDEDNLIGFVNNDVVMEQMAIKTEYIKIEDIKTEEDRNTIIVNADIFYCNQCGGDYKGYCPNCSSLTRILNKTTRFENSVFESVKSSILEIRIVYKRRGVFSLRTIPKNVIFGPFVGITTIECENRYMWRIVDKKFANVEKANWMKYVACAKSSFLRNLNIFQFGGDLYFRSDREIKVGEELLMDYGDIGKLIYNLNEFYFIPSKEEKFPKIFTCTLCRLGFGLQKCLIEHKTKCPYADGNSNIIEIIECHSCKIWLEKYEHLQYHMGYCWQNKNGTNIPRTGE